MELALSILPFLKQLLPTEIQIDDIVFVRFVNRVGRVRGSRRDMGAWVAVYFFAFGRFVYGRFRVFWSVGVCFGVFGTVNVFRSVSVYEWFREVWSIAALGMLWDTAFGVLWGVYWWAVIIFFWWGVFNFFFWWGVLKFFFCGVLDFFLWEVLNFFLWGVLYFFLLAPIFMPSRTYGKKGRQHYISL